MVIFLSNKIPVIGYSGTVIPCEVTASPACRHHHYSNLQEASLEYQVCTLIKTADSGSQEARLMNVQTFPLWADHPKYLTVVTSTGLPLFTSQRKLHFCLQGHAHNLASVCLGAQGFISVLSLVGASFVENKYTFPLADKVKAFLADISAVAAAARIATALISSILLYFFFYYFFYVFCVFDFSYMCCWLVLVICLSALVLSTSSLNVCGT